MRTSDDAVNKQSGASIVTVLVAIGIVGIMAAVSANYFKNSSDVSNSIRARNQIEDLRRLVRLSVNCEATLAGRPASCADGTPVELKRGVKTPTTFVSVAGSKFGDYEVRAKCGEGPHIFQVEFRRKQGRWTRLFPADVPLACRIDS